jgi:putative membrane protein
MMGGFGYGMGGGMMVISGLVMLLFWGGLIALGVWAVTRFTGRPTRDEDTVEQTLKRRLAAGQISEEEYERTRRTLQG